MKHSMIVALVAAIFSIDSFAQQRDFQLTHFSVDVTIPIGHRCMGVLPTKSKKIVDRLFAHGFVLLSHEKPIVLCAVDWCEIRNESYDQWRDALAKSVRTTRERVLVCTLHQHDAPVVDGGAARLLRQVGLTDELFDEEFHHQIVRHVANAAKQSLQNRTRVTHLGLGKSEVQKIASNRRVVLPDGRIRFSRGSRSGADKFHRHQDVGQIDPMLRTISFWDGDQALLELHSYATHPMSYYGRGEVSSDFVGLARDRRQRDDFNIKQIYVSGCSGDVTAGKFNDGSQESRRQLTNRLYQAMVASSKNTSRVPLTSLTFRSTPVALPFSKHSNLTKTALTAELHDESLTTEKRILAAMGLASRQRVENGFTIDFPCVDFDSVQMLLFPAEAFVGYQLMAQNIRPNSFVFSIGYGECWPGYIPMEASFQEGFGDSWLWVGPGSEKILRDGIRQIMDDPSNPR